MKKILFFLAMIPVFAMAQNVGIGNPNPAEKLDVNGNVNITGTLKANGNAGTAGQVLMSTGNGLSWGSASGYKRCVIIQNVGGGTWYVPAGVTEVMVELWGGGSGGTINCGGTSGGYARTVQTVTPGYGIVYLVGGGGAYGSTTSSGGGNTQVSFPLGALLAGGGLAVTPTSVGLPQSGSSSLPECFLLPGNRGTFTMSTYGQRATNIFVQTTTFGNGGAPVGFTNGQMIPGDQYINDNGSISIQYSNNAVSWSAGGPAGTGAGWGGGQGLILFWYN